MPIATKENSLVRLLTLPAAWRWGLIIVGLLLAIGSGILIYGAGSQSAKSQIAMYQSIRGTIGPYYASLTPGANLSIGEAYLLLDDSQSIYFFRGKDFNTLTFDSFVSFSGKTAVFIYRSDMPVNIDKYFGSDHVKGTGYQLVQITVFDSNGQNPQVFTTAEYTQYLQTKRGVNVGNIQNKRGIGIVLLILGLMMAALAFGAPAIRARLGKNKKQAPPNFAP